MDSQHTEGICALLCGWVLLSLLLVCLDGEEEAATALAQGCLAVGMGEQTHGISRQAGQATRGYAGGKGVGGSRR